MLSENSSLKNPPELLALLQHKLGHTEGTSSLYRKVSLVFLALSLLPLKSLTLLTSTVMKRASYNRKMKHQSRQLQIAADTTIKNSD